MSRCHRLLWLAAMAGGIGLALAALSATGHGPLAPPPLGSPTRWPGWFEQREPAEAAFALLRLAAVGGCWYLAAVTALGSVVRLLRADVLVAVVDRVTIAPVRHLLAASLTLTLVGIGPAAARTTTTTTSTTTTSVPADTVTMVRLPPAGGTAPGPAPPPAPEPVPEPERYTVVPGDCFWTIADDILHRSWGRPPTDAEIVPYWLRLIDANRSGLADPGNADLIFPGQVFDVPPLTSP